MNTSIEFYHSQYIVCTTLYLLEIIHVKVLILINSDSLLFHMAQFQDINGNDVLYVWTHLNLRGGDDTGISHNMTYELGA